MAAAANKLASMTNAIGRHGCGRPAGGAAGSKTQHLYSHAFPSQARSVTLSSDWRQIQHLLRPWMNRAVSDTGDKLEISIRSCAALLREPGQNVCNIALIYRLILHLSSPSLYRKRRRQRRIRLTETLSKIIHVNVNLDSEIRNDSVRRTLQEWWTRRYA